MSVNDYCKVVRAVAVRSELQLADIPIIEPYVLYRHVLYYVHSSIINGNNLLQLQWYNISTVLIRGIIQKSFRLFRGYIVFIGYFVKFDAII